MFLTIILHFLRTILFGLDMSFYKCKSFQIHNKKLLIQILIIQTDNYDCNTKCSPFEEVLLFCYTHSSRSLVYVFFF